MKIPTQVKKVMEALRANALKESKYVAQELNDEKFEPTSQRAFIYFCPKSKEWSCGDNYDRLGFLIYKEEYGWLFRRYDYQVDLTFEEALASAQQFFIP